MASSAVAAVDGRAAVASLTAGTTRMGASCSDLFTVSVTSSDATGRLGRVGLTRWQSAALAPGAKSSGLLLPRASLKTALRWREGATATGLHWSGCGSFAAVRIQQTYCWGPQ